MDLMPEGDVMAEWDSQEAERRLEGLVQVLDSSEVDELRYIQDPGCYCSACTTIRRVLR